MCDQRSSFWACILLCAILLACQKEEPLPILGFPDLLPDGREVPHTVKGLKFTGHMDRALDTSSIAGQVWVMNTFFTSCPSICPMTTRNVASVQDQFKDAEVHFMSLTINPALDTPARLRKYMASHDIGEDENWTFLTGDRQDIYGFARYQLFLSAMADTVPVTEDFIHSDKVVLVDRDRHIRGYYTGTDPDAMDDLSRGIRQLLRAQR